MIDGRLARVFQTFETHGVVCLLMGGQACVIYGAAEFSKDIDFAILAEAGNIKNLQAALDALDAQVIAVPPFEAAWLDEGLAVHFRCGIGVVEGLRIDVMSRMRNVDEFPRLWERRERVADGRGGWVNLMSLGDLVQAKKTQRDKDWPMIQRLLEVDYLSCRGEATSESVNFWLMEMRTPELLCELVRLFPEAAESLMPLRPLLVAANEGNLVELEIALMNEMLEEKARDREYWAPLKARLGELRRKTNRPQSG